MDFLAGLLPPVRPINHADALGNATLQSGMARSAFSGYKQAPILYQDVPSLCLWCFDNLINLLFISNSNMFSRRILNMSS